MDDTTGLFGQTISANSWPDYFSASLQMGADNVPNAPNTVDTVPTNAVQSMQPVSADQTQSFSGFWQDITKGVLGYAIAKDARASGMSPTPGAPGAVQTRRQVTPKVDPLVLLLAGGGLLYAMTKG